MHDDLIQEPNPRAWVWRRSEKYSRAAKARRWVEDRWVELLLGAAMLAVPVLFVLSLRGKVDKEKAFMAECVADGRKNYECVAMWRAGENHSQVMPVFIPMGSR